MGVRSGTEVLYVGDHIYGDILRSKKVCCLSGWWCACVFFEGGRGCSARACMLHAQPDDQCMGSPWSLLLISVLISYLNLRLGCVLTPAPCSNTKTHLGYC
jgi:hypothetical protein